MWFTMNSVGSQPLDLHYFRLLLHTENDVPQLLKCSMWDTQRKFSDYWVIITQLLQLLSVLTFHCNEVTLKLPPSKVLQFLLKPKGWWAPEIVPTVVTPGMDFASGPLLLRPHHLETLSDISRASFWHKLATSSYNTWGNVLLIKPFGNVTFPSKTSPRRGSRKEIVMPRQSSFFFFFTYGATTTVLPSPLTSTANLRALTSNGS